MNRLQVGARFSCMPLVAVVFPPRVQAGEWSRITRATRRLFVALLGLRLAWPQAGIVGSVSTALHGEARI
jgi:hypothetical protein